MIRHIPKSQQGYGAFNGGEIVENKPIGFPQDHSSIRPYSNLFYWAHARAVKDSTIGLHPHQGFEICSFVLKGDIRHYDTKLQEWRPLTAGDVQIIRAGNGISHSEAMSKDSEIFQIWFDPGLENTLSKPASYDDYRSEVFPQQTLGSARISTLVGEGSPFHMDAPGIEVFRLDLNEGSHVQPMEAGKIYSVYVLAGEPQIDNQATQESDFLLISDQSQIDIKANSPTQLFIIASPVQPGYRTYSQLMMRR
ncbi:MAG: pirin family protein [Chitinophagales bacterium]|nr:pirin family protein [Chitinophagales bacterium]